VDYRLLFTQRALDDLSEIVGHIAQDDGEAASRFGEAIHEEKRLVEVLHFRHGSRKPPKF
jgi:plasmid stabilization system protein ParE